MKSIRLFRPTITISLMIGLCLLFAFLIIGSKFGVKKAHACVEYPLPGSTTVYYLDHISTLIHFSLWYDTCTSSNYTSAHVIQGNETSGGLYVSVTRNSNPPVTEINHCSGTQGSICDSPEVYSPVDTAYAQINDDSGLSRTASF